MSTKIETTSCGCCIVKYDSIGPMILLVRPFQERDTWGIPKGHVDEGETHEACALRETLEEAGVEVELQDALSPVKTTYRKERKTVFSWLACLSDPTKEPFAADGENVDIRWFRFNELPTIHVYQRPLIQEVIAKISEREKSVSANGTDSSGNS